MTKTLLILNSITYAMKGRDLLLAHRIKADITRVPKSETLHGCGYGLLVYRDHEQARKILARAGIKVINQIEQEEKA